MGWDYERQVVLEFAKEVKAAGFRPFLSKSRTYGFYTDKEGTRVVSFQMYYLSIRLSGNYKTDNPKSTGTGWVMESTDIAAEFNCSAPRWATNGANYSYTTLEQYLKTYQKSSEFVEVTDEI